MSLSNYQSAKVTVAKSIFIAAVTLLPAWQLVRSAQDTIITHALKQRFLEAEYKNNLNPGDLAWVSGGIQAERLDLPQHLSRFTGALRVVERVESRRRSDRHRHWYTGIETEWITTGATLGRWHLTPDLIRRVDFNAHLASPCLEFRPDSVRWTVECPGAEYAYEVDNNNRRISYEVTPTPRGRVSLLAAISSDGNSLTLINVNDTWHEPFIILAWGEKGPHALLHDRLCRNLERMAFWWCVTTFVIGVWIFAALRRVQTRSGDEFLIGSTWRAGVAASPLLALFSISSTGFLIPAVLGAAAATAIIGFCLWFLARQET